MSESMMIYIVSHGVIAASCTSIAVFMGYCFWKRYSMFVHPMTVANVGFWLCLKATVHIFYVATFFTRQTYTTLMIVLALNAVASVFGAVSIIYILQRMLHTPSVREYQQTNKMLAQTLGETVEKLERSGLAGDISDKEKPL